MYHLRHLVYKIINCVCFLDQPLSPVDTGISCLGLLHLSPSGAGTIFLCS